MVHIVLKLNRFAVSIKTYEWIRNKIIEIAVPSDKTAACELVINKFILHIDLSFLNPRSLQNKSFLYSRN